MKSKLKNISRTQAQNIVLDVAARGYRVVSKSTGLSRGALCDLVAEHRSVYEASKVREACGGRAKKPEAPPLPPPVEMVTLQQYKRDLEKLEADCYGKIRTLQDANMKLSSEKLEAQNAMRDLVANRDATYAEHDRRIAELAGCNSSLADVMHAGEQELEASEQELESRTRELAAVRNGAKTMADELDRVRRDLASKTRELETVAGWRRDAEAMVRTLTAKTEELQGEVNSANKMIAEISQQATEAAHDHREAVNQLVRDLGETIRNLQQQLAEAKKPAIARWWNALTATPSHATQEV